MVQGILKNALSIEVIQSMQHEVPAEAIRWLLEAVSKVAWREAHGILDRIAIQGLFSHFDLARAL